MQRLLKCQAVSFRSAQHGVDRKLPEHRLEANQISLRRKSAANDPRNSDAARSPDSARYPGAACPAFSRNG